MRRTRTSSRTSTARSSRNFTRDIPVDANGRTLDGPCEAEPDGSCDDAPDIDERGHGTHVAGIIGAALNDLGIAGVAPHVTLVNLRAGQDSGFFFLQPTVDALTYAGDVGVDVVNMSYFLDPWLFNCADNPADSPADQAEQRLIIEATQRALDYAHAHGVTIIAAAGNQATDYSKPSTDRSSPSFADTPGEAPRTRDIDPATLPAGPEPVAARDQRRVDAGSASARPSTPTTASATSTWRPRAATCSTRPTTARTSPRAC